MDYHRTTHLCSVVELPNSCVEDELPSWHAREHVPVILLWNRSCSTSVGQGATQRPPKKPRTELRLQLSKSTGGNTSSIQCFQFASAVSVPCRSVGSGSGSCMRMALRLSSATNRQAQAALQGSSRRCCVCSGTPANALGPLKPEAVDNAISSRHEPAAMMKRGSPD